MNKFEEALETSPTLQRAHSLLTHPRAQAQLEAQTLKGLEKYGVHIDGDTPETYLEWLQHPLEEFIDLIVYLEKVQSLEEFQNASNQHKNWVIEMKRHLVDYVTVWSILQDREEQRVRKDVEVLTQSAKSV